MIHVIAILQAKPGRRADVLQAIRDVTPEVRAEDGCLAYGPAVDHADAPDPLGPDSFMVVEQWESFAHLQAHGETPHMRAYADRVKDVLERRTLHVLDPA
jgi:quinol monooxygenase YgiN